MMVKFIINNQEIQVEKGATILEAARGVGIHIPTLCYYQAIKPYGGCRLCVVDVRASGRTRMVASCIYPVADGIEVVTDSPRIVKQRKIMLELLLARAPESEAIKTLAREMGLTQTRFKTNLEIKNAQCILCGMCVRICHEVMGTGAIGFVNRGWKKYVAAPFEIRSDVCMGCGACEKICPTGAIKAATISNQEIKKIPSEYNMALEPRQVAYIPYAQAVPRVAVIDSKNCVHVNTGKCKVCEKFCEAKAIDFSQQEEKINIEVGSIVLAPGFETLSPYVREEYGYGYYQNVITSLEFERYLSASGPTTGHVQRPSDGNEPKKVAWIQCVGSRDEDRRYCSSVCCMYATKEAIIAKEHAHQLEPTIFFMDIRAFGKGFDLYYERAKKEYGIRYVRCMVSTVKEDSVTKNLIIRYINPANQIIEEEFELVVLSVGLKLSDKTQGLAKTLGIELNEHQFCATSTFTPMVTSRPGVYICGAASEPKDIPETVMQASGAAACIGELLFDVRGSLMTKKLYPPETDVSGLAPRIGVFVCRCGINIAGVIDVPSVVDYARTLPNVVCVEEKIYVCSQDSQALIRDKIKEHNLNRVVVASCTPRTHEKLFQDTIREAGLNKYLFEMANIRDQASWVHGNTPSAATQKAKDLVKMAVYRAALLEPLHLIPIDINRKAVVIGGGLSGMVSSLSLAQQGIETHLIEKEAELGGNLRHIYFTLNGSDPQAYLNSLILQVESNNLIKLHLETEVKKVSGHVGHFKLQIADRGISLRVVPIEEIECGVIIVATGGVEYQPTEYLYGQDERVITQLKLEEQIANSKLKTQNSKLKTVVMIQCVGSRNQEHPYCSRVCCSQAIKNALKIKETSPQTEVYILYRDVRTYGFKEDYYRHARLAGITFIRYEEEAKPVVRNSGSNQLEVEIFDPILQERMVLEADIVVLSPAILPHPDNVKLSPILKVTLNPQNFFLEAHLKLRPVDFASDGLFLCGLAHSPKDISESIIQAQAAAGRAVTILTKECLQVGGVVSEVNQAKCVVCLTCIRMCPYDVPFINQKGAAEIEAAKCQGCGICASECPAKAIQLMHYKDNQILAKTEALFV